MPQTSILEVGARSDNASSRPLYHTDRQQLPYSVDAVERVEVQVQTISKQTWWLATGRKLYNARSWKLWRFDGMEGFGCRTLCTKGTQRTEKDGMGAITAKRLDRVEIKFSLAKPCRWTVGDA